MEFANHTFPNEIILVGFSQDLQTRILFFLLFLVTYTLTILGNSLLICIIIISPRMHTPMYYFLCNLSFIDLCFSSSSLPTFILDAFSKRRRMSITGCLVQMNIGLILGSTECVLLAVMAYDRYIAIRHPLHYTVYMSLKRCKIITVIMWSSGLFVATAPIFKPLVFCGENTLNHFLCEILSLLELACGDITYHRTIIYVGSLFTLLTPFIFIVVSYLFIIMSILKIRSAGGRSRAFSTCASHLIVVLMFFGTIMAMYMGQSQRSSSSQKYSTLIYGVMTPVLNPFIYSLRNKEVKEVIYKVLRKPSASWII